MTACPRAATETEHQRFRHWLAAAATEAQARPALAAQRQLDAPKLVEIAAHHNRLARI